MTRTLRLTLVLLAVAVAGTALGAQQPTSGNGFISGVVVEGGTSRPVPGATVRIFMPGGIPRPQLSLPLQVIADAQGRFVFAGLPEGLYGLQTSRPGWLGGAYGLNEPTATLGTGGEMLSLATGERARVTVPLWRQALISGRVVDEAGEPIAGASVGARQWTATGGRRRMLSFGDIRTDDRGQFTVSIRPGEYMIAATSEQVRMRDGRAHVFRQTFLPGVPGPIGAAVMALRSGEERNGLVIQMSLEPAFRVTGTLTAVDRGLLPRLELRSSEGDVVRQFATPRLDPEGRFQFDHIPAGRYVLQSLAGASVQLQEPSENAELWVRVALNVDRDLDLSVNARRRFLVTGRVRFDGLLEPPKPEGGLTMGVRLFREEELPLTDYFPPTVPVAVDGTFALAVPPGRYVILTGAARVNPAVPGSGAATAMSAWSLRSATQGARNVVDVPFVIDSDVSGVELTFTDRPAVLRGRVTSREGGIASSVLLAFPVDQSLWQFTGGRRTQTRRLTADGAFELRYVPEGEYYLAAVRGGPSDYDSRNPALFAALVRSAKRVTVLEGQTTTQDLELIAAPSFDSSLALPAATFEPSDRAIVRELPANASTGATIAGTVLAAASNTPIANARVGLTPPFSGLVSNGGAYTDLQGRFTLRDVPAGQHTLYVSTAPHYVTTTFGAARPDDPGTPVTVTPRQQLSGLEIRLVKGALLGGTVVDHNGQPLVGVQVNFRAYRWTARGRELVTQRQPTLLGAVTNTRGEYRAFGLAPGDYLVQAVLPNANVAMPLTTPADVAAATATGTASAPRAPRADVRYTPMFYPNTPDAASAQSIRLRPGDERIVDFQFRLIPTATVTGSVRIPAGTPPGRLGVTLMPTDPLLPAGTGSIFGTVDETGAFTVRGVPPGRYRLATTNNASRLSGATELFVDGDRSGIVLDLLPEARITGRILADAATLKGLRVGLSPMTLGTSTQVATTNINADSSFVMNNVSSGRYRFELTGPVNVVKPRVASQIVNGAETIDAGLEVQPGQELQVDVAVTTSEARVGGTVRDRAGQPVANAYVVFFAKEPAAWTPPSRRILGLRPDQTGRYLFADVPAGEYLITTLADVEAGEWFDPAFLARLASTAAPVTVRRGDALEIALETR